jgi:hypothetical protein
MPVLSSKGHIDVRAFTVTVGEDVEEEEEEEEEEEAEDEGED